MQVYRRRGRSETCRASPAMSTQTLAEAPAYVANPGNHSPEGTSLDEEVSFSYCPQLSRRDAVATANLRVPAAAASRDDEVCIE